MITIRGGFPFPPPPHTPPWPRPGQDRFPSAAEPYPRGQAGLPLHCQRAWPGWHQRRSWGRETPRPGSRWVSGGSRSRLAPSKPLDLFAGIPTPLLPSLQDRIRPYESLRPDEGPSSFRLTCRVFCQTKLATLTRHIGGCHAQPSQPARDAPRLHPGPQLPANPLGQGGLIKRVGTAPNPAQHATGHRLRLNFNPMWGHPVRSQPLCETIRHGTSRESGLLEIDKRLFVFFLNGTVFWYVSGLSGAILTGGIPVSLQAKRPKPRSHRSTGKAGQLAKCGDTQPAEGRSQLFAPYGGDVKRSQELCLVRDDERFLQVTSKNRRLAGREWALGHRDSCSGAGNNIDNFPYSLNKSFLSAVVTDGSNNGDEHETGMDHLQARNQGFDCNGDRLKGPGLCPSILGIGDNGRAHRFGLPPQHTDLYVVGQTVGCNYPISVIDHLTRRIRRRV